MSQIHTEVTKTFTEDDVEQFAFLSGDDNPLHTDAEYAEGTRFGEPIVHGALVNSLISAALAQYPGTVIYLGQDVSFESPVYPGTELTARAKMDTKQGAIREVDTEVSDENGEIVVSGNATVMIDLNEADE